MSRVLLFIQAVNPLPRLLGLLPPRVAREVTIILTFVGGVLILTGRLLFPSGPVHDVVDAVVGVLAALGIRGEVTPVRSPRLRSSRTVRRK